MTKKLKGYYLPPSLEDLENELDFEERELLDSKLIVPKYFSSKIAEKIVRRLRNNQEEIKNLDVNEIAKIYDIVGKNWGKKSDYPKKAIALKYLPELTDYSPEIIEYYQFSCINEINKAISKDLVNYRFPSEVFSRFIQIPETETWIRAYASIINQLRLKRTMKSGFGELKLISYITPKNVPGIIETFGIFLGNIIQSAVLIKTPYDQPLFAPLYAESVKEISPTLGETIAVVPWKGGHKELEKVIYSHSDVVSVVSSNRTIQIISKDIQKLNKEGCNIKGCYHGQKFGLELVSKEFLRDEIIARKVAALIALDGAAYEGYMCSSPVLGIFIEAGGRISVSQFAQILVEESSKVSLIIPQNESFRKNRELQLIKLLSNPETNRKIFHDKNSDSIVVYEPKFELKPIGQNRLHRVFEIPKIRFLIRKITRWKKYLQTIGIAIPNERLFEQKIAEKLGRVGFSSLRVVGSACIPRLGETWDDNYPIYEYYIPDLIHWVSINAGNVSDEISRLYVLYSKLVANGVFN
ncbi:MAG: hypothetical protein HGN29_14760 [Asgard group archaeon]|nr:hypothetical protein [Asgard group archaeon]